MTRGREESPHGAVGSGPHAGPHLLLQGSSVNLSGLGRAGKRGVCLKMSLSAAQATHKEMLMSVLSSPVHRLGLCRSPHPSVGVGSLESVHKMLFSEIRSHRTAHSVLPGPRTHRRDIGDTRTMASKGRKSSRHLTELQIWNFSRI